MPRPVRVSYPDFRGRPLTLSSGPENWEQLKTGPGDLLLLGLGPENPAELSFIKQSANRKIYWLEEPDFLKAFPKDSLPPNFIPVNYEKAATIASGCQVYFYRPGLKLAPGFWSSVIASLETASANFAPSQVKTVWLPGNSGQLLHQELCQAFQENGFDNIIENMPQKSSARGLETIWTQRIPDFALSVNFRGLDSEGRIFHLCTALGIPLAIWLVDNPWHLLSACKLPWWQNAHIFVTDASYLSGLKAHGAKNASFCPLAASQHMRPRPGIKPENPPLFVGRSEFPDKASFFRGVRLPENTQNEADACLAGNSGILPDYHWWAARLGVADKLWPGHDCRAAGLGAENCSMHNRGRWLDSALHAGLEIIGDAGWKRLLLQAKVYPPVDYYGSLPVRYQSAACILNVTSLLLPQSLSQRHFDVWSAGGLLLTDPTPGIKIFPQELTTPATLQNPEEFHPRFAWFGAHPEQRRELIAAWREHLQNRHQYRHRVELMLKKTCVKNSQPA